MSATDCIYEVSNGIRHKEKNDVDIYDRTTNDVYDVPNSMLIHMITHKHQSRCL